MAPQRVENHGNQRSPREKLQKRKSDRRMNDADEAVFQAIKEAERIRSVTRKKSPPQVRGSERDVIRATALTWFQSHRPKIVEVFSSADLQPVDEMYQRILEASHKNAARSGYVAAPKDRQNQPMSLKDWTLQDYIGVAHELKWITVAAKDVGVVLRDYRNYIHPQKELSHGVSLTTPDAVILWEIGKSISRQLLK